MKLKNSYNIQAAKTALEHLSGRLFDDETISLVTRVVETAKDLKEPKDLLMAADILGVYLQPGGPYTPLHDTVFEAWKDIIRTINKSNDVNVFIHARHKTVAMWNKFSHVQEDDPYYGVFGDFSDEIDAPRNAARERYLSMFDD